MFQSMAFDPCENIAPYLLPSHLIQGLMAHLLVELDGDIFHAGSLEGPRRVHHALAHASHRVLCAGEEEKGKTEKGAD